MLTQRDNLGSVLLLTVALVVGATSSESADTINTPQELVHVFYENLLSDKPVAECPPIFYEPENYSAALAPALGIGKGHRLTATELAWIYLRENRNLFLFGQSDAASTIRAIKISYYFTFPFPETFFDGSFFVQIDGIPRGFGESAIIKNVLLPVFRATTYSTYRYLINFAIIRINGIILDPFNEAKRPSDLYKFLGFRSAERIDSQEAP